MSASGNELQTSMTQPTTSARKLIPYPLGHVFPVESRPRVRRRLFSEATDAIPGKNNRQKRRIKSLAATINANEMESKASNESIDAFSITLAKRPILKDLECPAIFKGMIDDWPCRRWTLQEWAQKFGEKRIRFRIGPIQQLRRSEPLWETHCRYIESTLEEFYWWQKGQIPAPSEACNNETYIDNTSEFSHIKRDVNWAYADYKHMLQLFEIEDNIHDSLDWGKFGFPNRKGQDSTIWIGSPHCHTPCHYDTYGCNLVAQLIGKKRWILYPPSETDCLYPTRVPYEESSVFSAVNIDDPNITRFPKFELTSPYVVTLEEGDVLFVPHKWWHFVKSLTTSVSINSWIPMDIDDERRLEEAVTRTVLSSYMSAHAQDEGLQWLNPTEEFTPMEVNIQYVKEALKLCLAGQLNEADTSQQSRFHQNVVEKKTEVSTANVTVKRTSKKLAIHAKRPRTKSKTELEQILFQLSDQVKVLKPIQYAQFINEVVLHNSSVDAPLTDNVKQNVIPDDDKDEDDKFKINLLNALVDTEVVSLICKKLRGTYL